MSVTVASAVEKSSFHVVIFQKYFFCVCVCFLVLFCSFLIVAALCHGMKKCYIFIYIDSNDSIELVLLSLCLLHDVYCV